MSKATTDTYANLVNSGLTGKLAKALGLPRPARLRRYSPGDDSAAGPVLIVDGGNSASAKDADVLAEVLLGWGVDVRRHVEGEKFAAIIPVFTGVKTPSELGGAAVATGEALRSLQPSGRVISISRGMDSGKGTSGKLSADEVAARRGVTGFTRSLAKEMRAGSTANGIVLGSLPSAVPVDSPSVIGAVRFLLSGRSAYVSGQFIEVGSKAGSLPENWELPLAGRVAVVTGAARGIGAAITRVLARDGATVVAVDMPNAGDALARIANQVRGTALQLDVTADDAGAVILEHALSRHGRLDIVVHNAGITRDKLLANMDSSRWESVLAVNVSAPLAISEQLISSGKLESDARIIGLASTSGIAGNRGQTNYAASKAGVMGMVEALGEKLPAGATANAVAPGFIETEMTARMPTMTRQVARRLNSLQQGGKPVDVAETIAFLASPQAGGITGTTLRVCGQNLVGA